MRKDRVDGSPFESEFAKMGAGQERALRPEELGGCAPVRCRRVTLSLFALSSDVAAMLARHEPHRAVAARAQHAA